MAVVSLDSESNVMREKVKYIDNTSFYCEVFAGCTHNNQCRE